MENLINKLREEADLTEEQAVKVLSIVKDYMDKSDIEIDWNKFFKGKYEDFSSKFQAFTGKVNEKAEPYVHKVAEVVDDLMSKAKKEAHELSQKAAEFFDEDKKK